MGYKLSEIKVAAYNQTPLPDMTQKETYLYQGLGYCYEWYRGHPEDKADCDRLAQHYIEFFMGKGNLSFSEDG